ncbi:hypothetical protein PGT21_025113 [Puccinia graminis f. sp. tritici]|uniref:RING-type domain-containing protein n=1 Tax=Puccinia graminis f. sp. tritici TaxID=56615 RepID=A0A5B0NZ92_PUCGR|nr:hypothetical protein PGT21_025113 [Puccinia graminis f. sp. tritici]KAA1127733.1 hypothetical protein PGTUg99_006878 [Puccinia graminis f. sp. tritici]
MVTWLLLLILVGNSLGGGGEQELSRFADPVQDVEAASQSDGVRRHFSPSTVDLPNGSHTSKNDGVGSLPASTPQTSQPRHEVILQIDDEERPEDKKRAPSDLHTGKGQAASSDERRVYSLGKEKALAQSHQVKPNLDCPICLAELDPRSGPIITSDCGHSFDKYCINCWLYTERERPPYTCPVCRAELRLGGKPAEPPKDPPEGLPLPTTDEVDQAEPPLTPRNRNLLLDNWVCASLLSDATVGHAMAVVLSIYIIVMILGKVLPAL